MRERIGLGAAVVVVLALGATACGGSGSSKSAKPAAAAASGNAVKVALVTDSNQLNDHGFNHLAYVGMLRAQSKLGVKGRVLESRARAEYIPNLAAAARQGASLVVAVGFDQADAVDTVARQFPKTHFAIVDVAQTDLKHKPANVRGLLFKEQEVGYLVGYLAGLEAKRTGVKAIGSVGGQKQPPVDRYIAGYRAGAAKADPGIKLLNGYSQDWVDQAKCKTITLNQIQAGSKIEFQVAGGCGLGTLQAAKEKGIWGIGVDADQSFLGPQVLTSALKRVDQAVYETIKSVQDGSFKGGNAVFGLKDQGVGLGKVSPKVPKSEIQQVDQVAKQVVAGKILIPTSFKG
jgi:basic membrane protein A